MNWIDHVVQASKRHLDKKLSVKHLFGAFIAKLIISGGLDPDLYTGPTHKKGFSMFSSSCITIKVLIDLHQLFSSDLLSSCPTWIKPV